MIALIPCFYRTLASSPQPQRYCPQADRILSGDPA
jgi:hypothetical protein